MFSPDPITRDCLERARADAEIQALRKCAGAACPECHDGGDCSDYVDSGFSQAVSDVDWGSRCSSATTPSAPMGSRATSSDASTVSHAPADGCTVVARLGSGDLSLATHTGFLAIGGRDQCDRLGLDRPHSEVRRRALRVRRALRRERDAQQLRPGLHIPVLQLLSGGVRQQENYCLSVRASGARAMPPRVQELLGYSVHPPFMGHANGLHPRRGLEESDP